MSIHSHRTLAQTKTFIEKQRRRLDRKQEYDTKYKADARAVQRMATRAAFGYDPLRPGQRDFLTSGISKPKCELCQHQHPMSSDRCHQRECGCVIVQTHGQSE